MIQLSINNEKKKLLQFNIQMENREVKYLFYEINDRDEICIHLEWSFELKHIIFLLRFV